MKKPTIEDYNGNWQAWLKALEKYCDKQAEQLEELKKALTQIFEEEVFCGRTSKATLDMIDELLNNKSDD